MFGVLGALLIPWIDSLDSLRRMLVYRALEDTLYNFGLNGRDCLLRAICEIHESPLHGHGLLGELLQFIFT